MAESLCHAPVELIRRKRDGETLSDDTIQGFIQAYTDGEVPDYQMSAFLMAVYLKGMTVEETRALTLAMLHSGAVVDFSDVPGLKVDKHSTGGVGDKTSLVLAPVVAAAGVAVPMISGRGLGHTGGTLDKLESIPGFRTDLSLDDFRRLVSTIGVGLIGQTPEIAPADKKLYALRDVTGTVESLALITASIMSKKLAEGIDALVLDVKCGNGAFMKTPEQAKALANSLKATGEAMGKRVTALITDMNQPLGCSVGNSLEVIESQQVIRGELLTGRFAELSIDLSAHMILLGKAADSLESAREVVLNTIRSGAALQKWREIIGAQGGNPDAAENDALLPTATKEAVVTAPRDGFVSSIETEAVGMAGVVLGAGRLALDSIIDPSVGFKIEVELGTEVKKGDPLVRIAYNRDASVPEVKARLERAFRITDERPEPSELILS